MFKEIKKNITDKNESQFDMIKKLELDRAAHEELIEYCNSRDIRFLSTAFDHDSVDLLAELDIPLYKIPSGEITNLPYLRHIGSMGKPIILSTGMSTMDEVRDALNILIKSGAEKDQITILHCNTEYPTPMEDVNLKAMLTIKDELGVNIGYSDHTLGIEIPIAAVAMGATVIEKHFTLSRDEGGVDSAFSIEPDELKALVVESKRAWQSLGHIQYGPTEKEKASLAFRRSLYIAEDIQKGTTLTAKNLRAIRPGLGLPPKYYELLLGKPVNQDIKKGTPMSWDLIG